jgi:ParB-like chromosome segregation protein Spo0J
LLEKTAVEKAEEERSQRSRYLEELKYQIEQHQFQLEILVRQKYEILGQLRRALILKEERSRPINESP